MTRPTIGRKMREAVARRFGAEPGDVLLIRCHYCRTPIWLDWSEHKHVRFLDMQDRSTPELDHVDPLYWGGAHTVENLVAACMPCNRSKGPRRLAESA
jgi:5-methylcytosine-specific restriction endonuclease McrA